MAESARVIGGRLLSERAIDDGASAPKGADAGRPARSPMVNLAESPLGWLHARGHVTTRQYVAVERSRSDWERAQLDPQVTMRWDAAPIRRGRGGRARGPDPSDSKVDAQARFLAAVDSAGPGASRYRVAGRLRGRGNA